MLQWLLLSLLAFMTIGAFAQSNATWVRDFQSTQGYIYTFIDQETDAQGNTYLSWIIADFVHMEFVAKVSPTGAVVWLDTLQIPNRVFGGSWPKGSLDLVGDRLVVGTVCYPSTGYGEAAVIVLDTAGQQLYHREFPVQNGISPWAALQDAQHNVYHIYSEGSPFDANITVFVNRMDPMLNLQWTKSYPMPKVCHSMAALLDGNGNLIYSYSSDSIVSGTHYIMGHTRSMSPSGQELWHHTRPYVNYGMAVMAGNNVVLAGKEYNATNYMSNDSGNAVITFVDASSGIEMANNIYNASSPWREIPADLRLDGNGDVWWMAVENVGGSSINYSTIIRKYSPTGNLAWSVGTPSYPLYSNPGSLELDASGRMWACNLACVPPYGVSTLARYWRMDGSGGIDSTLVHSLGSLYYGIIHGETDAHNNHYMVYQQAQCGNNLLGVVKFGAPVDPVSVNPSFQQEYMLYPNPAHGEAMLGFHAKASGSGTLSITDLSGRKVRQVRQEVLLGWNDWIIPLEGLKTGLLFLEVEVDGQVLATAKLVHTNE